MRLSTFGRNSRNADIQHLSIEISLFERGPDKPLRITYCTVRAFGRDQIPRKRAVGEILTCR